MIFLSYSQKDSEIADNIDAIFKKTGQKLKRDIRDLEYKQSIKEFMKQIRDSDFAIILLTENYLQSSNCMFEILEFLKEKDYKNRIIPIIKKTADIFSGDGIIRYITFWQEKKNALERKMHGINLAAMGPLTEKLKHYENISSSISDILSEITGKLNVVFENTISNENYETIFLYMNIGLKIPKNKKHQSKNSNAIIVSENIFGQIQSNIDIAVEYFSKIMIDLDNIEHGGRLYFAEYINFPKLLDNWVITIGKTNLHIHGSLCMSALQHKGEIKNIFIFLDDSLFLNEHIAKVKKHTSLAHCLCTAFAWICSYLSVPEETFISRMNEKMTDFFKNTKDKDSNDEFILEDEMKILMYPDSHYRIGIEKVSFDYSVFLKKLLFNKKTFETVFDAKCQIVFKKMFDTYRIDEAIEVVYNVCEKISNEYFLPIKFIKKEAIELIHNYM